MVVVLSVAFAALGTPATASAATSDLPPPSASPEEVRQQADDVLARPEFQRPEPSIVDKAQSWLQEQIGRVLQRLVSGDGASVLGWLILLGAIAAIAFFLARLGRTVQADPRQVTGITVERSRRPDEWDAEAERLEGEGEWKAALRCRFRALVGTLVAQGHVDDVPGRTTGEYRAEVAAALPGVDRAFAGATLIFEAAWYGNQPTGGGENRRFRALADEVLAAGRAVDSAGPTAAELVSP